MPRHMTVYIMVNTMLATLWIYMAWYNAMTIALSGSGPTFLPYLLVTCDVLFSRGDFIAISRKSRDLPPFVITDRTADFFSVLASVGTSTYLIIMNAKILAGEDIVPTLIVVIFMLASTYVLASKARDKVRTEPNRPSKPNERP